MTSRHVSPTTGFSARHPGPAQIGLAGLALAVVASLSSTRCDNERCEELRESLYREKLTWQSCQTSSDCLIIGGNEADCTGVLSCNIAVNRDSRLTAERRVASLPELTVDCHECGSPNCDDGEIPYCEPVTGLCIIVGGFLDAGRPNALEAVEGEVIPTSRPVPLPERDAAAPQEAAGPDLDAASAPDVVQFPF